VALLADWWVRVSGTVLQGIGVTVAGMLLVFVTLGLVIVAMVILTRIPWLRRKEPSTDMGPAVPTAPEKKEAPSPVHEADLARIAVVAVAVLRSRQSATSRGQRKPRGGTWRSYGRAHQLGL
jgi:Na+-transporting methylmalonyl-CoA/oxaloacetate decarboxylase gamma subunit